MALVQNNQVFSGIGHAVSSKKQLVFSEEVYLI